MMMLSYITGYRLKLPEEEHVHEISKEKAISFKTSSLVNDKSIEGYPSRSDEKVMRKDVVSSVIMIQQMVKEHKLEDRIHNLSLFVANGAFVEDNKKHLAKLANAYKKVIHEADKEARIKSLFRASPPLVALETLTNSTMSFIAQYSGIKGNNASFGNTSLSAYYALQEAMASATESIVISSNSSGNHSYLTNIGVVGNQNDWKESSAVGGLIICNNNHTPQNALCRIKTMRTGTTIPKLEQKNVTRNWNLLIDDYNADLVIHSGAYSKSVFKEDQAYLEKKGLNTFSFYNNYGNVGAANITLSIIEGIRRIEKGYNTVDILDRDIYGRESYIRIEKCK